MEEIRKSVKEGVMARINSPLYGAFVISWVAVHWQVFVVLFFVDEAGIWAKTGLLKSEFIYQYLLNPNPFNPMSKLFYAELFITVLLTFLVIWIFPKYLARPAYKQQQHDETQKEIIRTKEQIKLREEQQKLALADIVLLEKKKEQADKNKDIEKTKTQEEKWQEEFEKTKKDEYLHGFIKLVEAIYKEGGILYSYQIGNSIQKGTEILAYAGTRDLIDTKERKGDSSIIKLTDKGKYFYRLFSDSGLMNVNQF